MKKPMTSLLRRFAAMLLSAVLLLSAIPTMAASGSDLTVTFSVTTYQNRARQVLSSINTLRKKAQLEPLTMLSDLEKVAIQRAAELFVHFDHKRPDMTDYDTADDSYTDVKKPLYVGETIAAGFAKADEVVDEWTSTEDGQENLLSADFTHVGIACVYVSGSYNEYYWVAYLQGYDEVKATKAAQSVKAGVKKTMTVEIKKAMFSKADSSHRSFLIQCKDVDMKSRKTAKLKVMLVDKKGVTIGTLNNADLTFKSGTPTILTVLKDGALRQKKTGVSVVTVKAPSLDAIKVNVTCGSGATALKLAKPTLSVSQTSKTVTLSVTQKAADGFILYRATTKSGAYRKVDEQSASGKYTFKIDVTDDMKTYWYKIKTYAVSTGEVTYSDYSAPVKVAK